MNHPQTAIALAPVRAPMLELPGIAHGFFTRPGGVSVGLYEGLNVGVGSNDDQADVRETDAASRAIWVPTMMM